jgi:uncharacterized metal-binding protein
LGYYALDKKGMPIDVVSVMTEAGIQQLMMLQDLQEEDVNGEIQSLLIDL